MTQPGKEVKYSGPDENILPAFFDTGAGDPAPGFSGPEDEKTVHPAFFKNAPVRPGEGAYGNPPDHNDSQPDHHD